MAFPDEDRQVRERFPRPTDDSHSPPDASGDQQEYDQMLRSVRRSWEERESRGDGAVQMSRSTLAAIKESVRADARHGAQVRMPPTPAGPYTVTELTLRTLVRETVDSVPGASALRSRIEHEGPGTALERGLPIRIVERISASWATRDLPVLAEAVRTAVLDACDRELDLHDVTVDIHIEDLHDDPTA